MQDPSIEPALSSAIAAMRSEIDGIIDEELARLRGTETPVETLGAIDPTSIGPEVAPRAITGRFRPAGPPGPLPPSSDLRGGGSSDVVGDDAERRLDALALRLEGRLKRSRDREVGRPGSEPDSGPDALHPEGR